MARLVKGIGFKRKRGTGGFLILSGGQVKGSATTRRIAISKQEEILQTGRPAVVVKQTSGFRTFKLRKRIRR